MDINGRSRPIRTGPRISQHGNRLNVIGYSVVSDFPVIASPAKAWRTPGEAISNPLRAVMEIARMPGLAAWFS
jgi:hypothetical protein